MNVPSNYVFYLVCYLKPDCPHPVCRSHNSLLGMMVGLLFRIYRLLYLIQPNYGVDLIVNNVEVFAMVTF